MKDDKLFFDQFPTCILSNDTVSASQQIIVTARLGTELGTGSALRVAFGSSVWISLVFMAGLAELYVSHEISGHLQNQLIRIGDKISLTKNEDDRLRKISYQKQIKAGHANPGSAGLTSDRFGDVDWKKPSSPKT